MNGQGQGSSVLPTLAPLLCLACQTLPSWGPRKPPPHRASCGQRLGPGHWRIVYHSRRASERGLWYPEVPGMQLLKAGLHCESLSGPEGDPYSGEPGMCRLRKARRELDWGEAVEKGGACFL